ncbi:DoxX family membrane protein [Mucilaginibacter litoreus]|uniref:DoxX family membrane protein n=1 Tax=Mucilaginibacter litoreus TaxID=1048221 RepID=A0ABW3AST0_9SPHI
MQILKKISLVILVIGYLIAGANHFIHPQGYVNIIPAYLPAPHLLNYLAGSFEILFSILLIRPKTRKVASWGIILMLLAFLPVHIDMLVHAPLKIGSIMVTPVIAWMRLMLQPVLILWAWWHSKS